MWSACVGGLLEKDPISDTGAVDGNGREIRSNVLVLRQLSGIFVLQQFKKGFNKNILFETNDNYFVQFSFPYLIENSHNRLGKDMIPWRSGHLERQRHHFLPLVNHLGWNSCVPSFCVECLHCLLHPGRSSLFYWTQIYCTEFHWGTDKLFYPSRHSIVFLNSV